MKRIFTALMMVLLFAQCAKEDNLIKKHELGDINKDTSLKQLDEMYKNDSIDKFPKMEEPVREYRVFDLDGKPALTFQTKVVNDSIKGLELVKIYSSQYVTEKGLSTASVFKDVVDNYSIDKIENAFSSAVLFVDELNLTIALDKKDLKIDEFDMREIRQEQIPDQAKIKYITLWLE